MSLTNNIWGQNTGGGLKWVDGWVNTKLSQGTRQHSVGIQMCEGGSWGRISEIICWHIDSLDRGDGTRLGGGDSLLKGTQIGGEGWLISDSGWDTTKQGRHLRTGLSESEDVINEEKHILVLLISEVLSDGESSKGDSSSGTWWLVHLTVDEGTSGTSGVVAIKLDDTGLNHFVVKIIALTSSLADTSEHGVTTMSLSDVVNKLHDKHSLADTGTTEKTNLTSLLVRSEEIDDLNTYSNESESFGLTSDKHIGTGTLLGEGWGVSMDWKELISLNWALLVDGLTNDVDDSTKSLGADWHSNWIASVSNLLTSNETLSGVEGDGSHVVATKMLSNLEDESVVDTLHLKGVEDRWKVALELHIDDGTNDLGDLTNGKIRTECSYSVVSYNSMAEAARRV